MIKNKNVNFAENPIYLLILFIKLKKNQIFLISQMFEISFNKCYWNFRFAKNSIHSLILVQKIKRNQSFWILKILKISFNDKK